MRQLNCCLPRRRRLQWPNATASSSRLFLGLTCRKAGILVLGRD